jgi:hypothetical protein
MLEADEQERLLELEDWLIFLQEAARRTLIAPALTEAEYARLGQYGAYVAQVTRAAIQDLGVDEASYHEAVVVPLARTGAGVESQTLIEATGTVDEIYLVIERSHQLYLARGGVYAQYEFIWPTAVPLDDQIWRERLARSAEPGDANEPADESDDAGGQAPARPPWVAGFVVGGPE